MNGVRARAPGGALTWDRISLWPFAGLSSSMESPVYALAYFCLARVALASITPWMLPLMVSPCAVRLPVTLPGR